MLKKNFLFPGNIYKQFKKIPKEWRNIFFNKKRKPLINRIFNHIEHRIKNGAEIYPSQPFQILQEIKSPSDVNVVILGQDPYYLPGQAQGISFAVPNNSFPSRSLKNIYMEIKQEFPNYDANKITFDNNLLYWVKQGVFLLNSILTVEKKNQPAMLE